MAERELPVTEDCAANSFSFSNDVSASPPRPTPHWRKKCRRVLARNASSKTNCGLFMRLCSDDVSEPDVRMKMDTRQKPIYQNILDSDASAPTLLPTL